MIRDMKSRQARSARPRIQRSPGEATTGRAHLSALKGIPQVLARFGIPSEPILASVNLRASDLDDPERSAPFGDLDRLLGLCLGFGLALLAPGTAARATIVYVFDYARALHLEQIGRAHV